MNRKYSIHSKRTYGAPREKIPMVRLRRFIGMDSLMWGKYPALSRVIREWRENRIKTGRSHRFADRILSCDAVPNGKEAA